VATEKNRQGVVLFVVSEAIFFLMLIMAYVFYHRSHGNGAQAAQVLDPLRTGAFSVALLASSLTLWRAERRVRSGHPAGAWLAATFALGAIFLVGQVREYLGLVHRDVTISRDLFGTTFFTLTGFHGLHVAAGLVVIAILCGLALARRGAFVDTGIEAASVYWHFVDGVWVVIFAVVYLWGRMA